MIKRIAHICIGCTDLAAVEKFYCDCLGFEKRFDFMKQGKRIGFYLYIGDETFLEFFVADEVPRAGSPIRHLCLETDDIDDVIARLKQHGYNVETKKVGSDNTWQVWTHDAPDGVAIEFHQYTADSSQHTGKTCEVNW